MLKYDYNTQFNPTENLMRGSHLCSLGMVKNAIEEGADVNCENGAVLVNVIIADCSNENKKKVINYLSDKKIQIQGDDTLLSLSILRGDPDLISFCWTKVLDFKKEELSLLYALQTYNCNYVVKLLKKGVEFSEKSLEYVDDVDNLDVQKACKDLYQVHKLNNTISISSETIAANIFSLEQNILIGHHICEFFLQDDLL